MKSDFLK